MKKIITLFILVASIVLLVGCKKDDTNVVKLGYVNWAEGIAMTHLAAVILEDEMGYDVEVTQADVAPTFVSVANGSTDAFLDVWLPVTHKNQMEKYGDDLVNLGVNYEGAKIGLVVPEYVEINSIEELNRNKSLFDGKIIGIDSGAGIMSTTEIAIDAYNLDFELITSSEAAMIASLKRAYDNQEPIVITGWEPHWKFADFDLKFLEDPDKIYGESEAIHTIVRKGLKNDKPEVYEFLEHFLTLSADDLGELMARMEAKSNHESEFDVARIWKEENIDVVKGFLPKG
jgi:glycine betaine/proline transport system substrate-binding protein